MLITNSKSKSIVSAKQTFFIPRVYTASTSTTRDDAGSSFFISNIEFFYHFDFNKASQHRKRNEKDAQYAAHKIFFFVVAFTCFWGWCLILISLFSVHHSTRRTVVQAIVLQSTQILGTCGTRFIFKLLFQYLLIQRIGEVVFLKLINVPVGWL